MSLDLLGFSTHSQKLSGRNGTKITLSQTGLIRHDIQIMNQMTKADLDLERGLRSPYYGVQCAFILKTLVIMNTGSFR